MEIFTSEFLKILDVQPTEAKVYKEIVKKFVADVEAMEAKYQGNINHSALCYLAQKFLIDILKLESQVRIALAIKEKYNITTLVDKQEHEN